MQQQQDDFKETMIIDSVFLCQVVVFFIVNFLKKPVILPKYRKELITPPN